LCGLLGHLSTLGFELTMENSVPYDHNDLNNTFIQFRNLIFRILDESIGEKYHAIPFERQGNVFRIKINKQWLDQPLIIGITVRGDKTDIDVVNWISSSLIGSEDEIIIMKKQRTLGIQRKRINKDTNFPVTLDTIYYSLETQSVKADQALVILNPSDYAPDVIPASINLYVRRRFEL
jgi:predicted component of type VI protein secretion system